MKAQKSKAYTVQQEREFFFMGIWRHRSHVRANDWRGFYKRNQEKCELKSHEIIRQRVRK